MCENLSGFCCSKSFFWEDSMKTRTLGFPNLVFIHGKHENDKRGKEEFPETAGAEEPT